MKIRPVGAENFPAGGWVDRHGEVALSNFPNAPKKSNQNYKHLKRAASWYTQITHLSACTYPA